MFRMEIKMPVRGPLSSSMQYLHPSSVLESLWNSWRMLLTEKGKGAELEEESWHRLRDACNSWGHPSVMSRKEKQPYIKLYCEHKESILMLKAKAKHFVLL